MKLEIIDQKGKKTGKKIEVDESIWAVPMNHAVVSQALRVYQDNQRKYTAHSKTRGEVTGGGRKPWRQKGTGRARQGSIRAPQWVKGGVVFGPISYKKLKSIPKKMMTLAVKSVLSEFVRREEIKVVDKVTVGKEKLTSGMAKWIEDLGLEGRNTLIVIPEKAEEGDGIRRAIRNLESVALKDTRNFNVYDLARAECLIVLTTAIDQIEKRLK